MSITRRSFYLSRRAVMGAAFGLAATVAASTALPVAAQEIRPVKIGFAPWSDAEFVTKLAAKLIEDELGGEVELVQTDVAPLYQGIARGDLDAMMMAWLPETQADYFAKVKDSVETLGTVYDGTTLGWAVPAYIPESDLATIEDLNKPEVRAKMPDMVQGIDPGAGLTRLSEQALKDYGLDGYRVQTSSEAGLLTSVARSYRSESWFVTNAWSPHWMFGKYKLRYLEDPKNVFGDSERVDTLAHKGFSAENPKVAGLLSRIKLEIPTLEAAMAHAQETSYDEAVAKYIADNPEQIKTWVGEDG